MDLGFLLVCFWVYLSIYLFGWLFFEFFGGVAFLLLFGGGLVFVWFGVKS